MKDRIEEIIYDWVEKNFGTSEAEDPSWNIEALAEEIAEHAWEIHSIKEQEYAIRDIKKTAENMDIKLSEDELSLVLHRYEKEEDTKLSAIPYIIEEVKKGE